MQLRALAVIAAAISLTGFACERKADTAAEEQAIRGIVSRFNEYIVARNDSAIAAAYAADAVMLPPNERPVTGTSAIRTYWAAMWPMNPAFVITPATVKVASSGDMASEEGTWTFSGTLPAGPTTDSGKYLVVWIKDGGQWKVAQDMWSSNNPPPPMPSDTAAGAR